jgi:alpha-beta hydrolase superfamily lysophospholipase
MSTRHDEGVLARKSPSDPALYFRTTVPDGRARAVVGLLHGYADHSARYAHVMDAWAERGIATVAIDMRGHGRAEGRRGHCNAFEEFLDDARELLPLIAKHAPDAPPFLFGHSFGGLVASSLALASPAPWRALVLSGPFFGLAMRVPRVKIAASRVVSKFVPTFSESSGLRGADLTHDPVRAKAYEEDPLVFKTATVRWFTEAEKAQASAIERAPQLTMPLYVAMGTDDRAARFESAKMFFDRASSKDKSWNPLEGLFHEILNEPGWRPIADAMAEWMLARA